MPERLQTPYEPGTQSYESFKEKVTGSSETHYSQGFPIAQANEFSVYYKTDNTANDVVDIAVRLEISSDGQYWDEAPSPFTQPIVTVSLVSGDESVWTEVANIPTYATLARIKLVTGSGNVNCKLTVHSVVSRKTA